MTTAPPQLRARTVTQLLDHGIRLYRKHFVRLTLMSAAALVPLLLLQLIPISAQIPSLIGFAQSWFVMPILTGALTSAGVEAIQERAFELRDAFAAGGRSFLKILVASMLSGLVMSAPVLIIGAVIAVPLVMARLDVPLTIALVALACAPVLLFFATKYAVILPAIMVEQVKGGVAMSRSWELTTGFFWHAAGTMLMTSILGLLITVLPIGATALAADQGMLTALSGDSPVTAIATTLAMIISVPLQSVLSVALYYDLRIRREGYHIEVALQERAASLGEGGMPPPSGPAIDGPHWVCPACGLANILERNTCKRCHAVRAP